ncbi:MAG: monofunctional biosynthetic peptidoglycan transglycosylase [Burkholderiaceae bacterium]|jgi:monofunctional glycosyltransferase|nr:monofunctional biosynthetic peptidoglycan transglycosylase [Burkholderiaceae bacterium]
MARKGRSPGITLVRSPRRWWWTWGAWLLIAGLTLQLLAVGRIALMAVVDPQSTSLQRSEAWRLMEQPATMQWQQRWVADEAISNHLRRAVIASEDSEFFDHNGVDWDAIQGAWQRNTRAQARATKQSSAKASNKAPKIVGGSTITQQLAKNLLLSRERTFVRKGQELLLTFALEACLSKQRILTIYLNSVEWGDGIFGAEAAAQHYFKKPAAKLSTREAAKLAVMLPNPKFFEDRPNSGYLQGRTNTIQARMAHVRLPKVQP